MPDQNRDAELDRLLGIPEHMQTFAGSLCSDVANAERFLFLFGDRVRYCPEQQTWYIWNGARWEADRMLKVEFMAQRVASAVRDEASVQENEDVKKALNSWAKNSSMHGRIKALLSCAQCNEAVVVRQDHWDADPWLLNLQNGTYELRNGKFRDHNRDDMISCMAPVDYTPDSPGEQFAGFLDTITSRREELLEWLQRFLGYCVSGDTGKQIFGLFHGPSSTGKSTLLNIVHETLGNEYAGTVNAASLFKPYERESQLDFNHVVRCRLVTTSESIEGKYMPEAFIKSLTGGERISVREMYQKAYDFRPKFKLILGTNFRPNISESGNAVWRRMVYVPFDAKIESPDRRLADKILQAERSAVLRWLIAGFKLQHDTEADGSNFQPEVVGAAVKSYREEEDVVGDFLKEYTEKDADSEVAFRDIFAVFVRVRKRAGDRWTMSEKSFANRLTEHGIWKTENTKVKTRAEIRLNDYAMEMLDAIKSPGKRKL